MNTHLKARKKSKDASHSQSHADASHYRSPAPSAGHSAFYSAGPVPGISKKEVSIGKSGDKYEKEADAATEKISSGQQAGMISRMANEEVNSQEKNLYDDDETSVQKQEIKKPEENPKPVQKEEIKEPESTVQTSKSTEAGSTSGTSMNNAASHAISNKGSGSSLSSSTQGALESGFGTGFSDVKVHNDSKAHEAADALSARAFTHGSDIWLGKGESKDDMKLMAHEAAHVVQQTGRVQRMVQLAKTKKDSGGNDNAGVDSDDPGKIDIENKTITYEKLKISDFKVSKPQYSKRKGKLKRSRGYDRKKNDPKQDQKWKESFQKNEVDALKTKIKKRLGSNYKDAKQEYALKHSKSSYHIIGTVDSMAEKAIFPLWDRQGNAKPKDIDHVVELQISGWGGTEKSDDWPITAGPDGNLELMDSVANQASGRDILIEVIQKIQGSRNHWPDGKKKDPKKNPKAPSIRTIKKDFDLVFKDVIKGLGNKGDPTNYWTWKEIAVNSEHLDDFIPATGDAKGADKWLIFPTSAGGEPKTVKPGKNRKPEKDEVTWLSPLFIDNIDLRDPAQNSTDKIGRITLDASKEAKKYLDIPKMKIDVTRSAVLPNAAYLMNEDIMGLWRKAKVKGLSPISIRSWDIHPEKGFLAYGTILPDVKIFEGTGIDFAIEGNKIEFRKLFDTGDFQIPGPIQVTSSTLEVYAGTAGVGVKGDALFEINKVGNGRIGAGAGITLEGESSFEIEGEFNFDTELFDEATIKAWYKNNALGAKGRLAINKDGKVRGIKSASVDATYEKGTLNAKGTAELSIPGIKTVNMAMSYSEKKGLAIGGSFELKDDIPGIKSGSGQALVKQRPDGSGYDITASGKAVPNIPGISSSIDITYENGAITIEGTAAYQKGMLNGSVLIGVTNRPVSADGKPAGEPGKKLMAYGGGSVTVKIAPWLQGTVAIKLTPSGEVQIAGTIGLPNSLDIFPEKKLDKNIFKINMDIPIVGLAVLGQRIGIFATIGGGLDLAAGIGPGQLRDTAITIEYNPAHEEQTHVKGGAKLFIPAHAGLRMFVRGALGAGIPIVSASAGLEIGGVLGIEGAISAGVQMDWTPAKGLVLDALGEIYAEPKFKFDITGFVLVEADIVLSTVELYKKRWQLAGFEYGSGLRFGVKFPIHYEEGKPFDISMKDVQFEVPQIDKEELLKGLIKRIA